MANELIVVGGGLAGSEAAWQAAEAGIEVRLYEMRPGQTTPAHETEWLAELVCSNSLGSDLPHKAPGLLKAELRGLGSLILDCATVTAVPAGSSLAVDREGFARLVTERVAAHPRITLVAEEMPAIVDALGEEGALEEVDVVTTGTFGAMCSSGAFFNFGHDNV